MRFFHICDVPKSGGSLINHQPTENLWISCNLIPHRCVPFIGIHNFTKIGQSLLRTGTSGSPTAPTQNQVCAIYNIVGKQHLPRRTQNTGPPRVRQGKAHLFLDELLRLSENLLRLGEAKPKIQDDHMEKNPS